MKKLKLNLTLNNLGANPENMKNLAEGIVKLQNLEYLEMVL